MPNEVNDWNETGGPARGWRLHRLEMANWGTFGEDIVHVVTPECGWTLLVGENGSGKSTTIDALRTLLAPRAALRHSFNDAAGGQKKQDRSLISYIRGAWSASRDEESGDTETRFLRKEETPSYLLSVFRNARSGTALTLAQILWVANGKDETMYLLAGDEKSIASDLGGLEKGRTLKKELAARGFDVRDTYKSYREDLCSRMGIPGEGALEIFNQAIGVKEVSDVGVFLRRHLLSQGTIVEFLRERVIPRFNDLESCWNDIEKAKKQIEVLGPVAAAYERAQELEGRRKEIKNLADHLDGYYLKKEALLVRQHLDNCKAAVFASNAQIEEFDRKIGEYQKERDALKDQLLSLEVTNLIKNIEAEIREISLRCDERQKKSQQLAGVLQKESLGSVPGNEEEFTAMRQSVGNRIGEVTGQEEKAHADANQIGVEKAKIEERVKGTENDLQLLHQQRVLIPSVFQYLREEICVETGLRVEELPFAGELMEVKPEYTEEWSGAIEKLLHNFGVSLLVPERYYQRVVPLINGRPLRDASGRGARLSFHRVTSEGLGLPGLDGKRVVAGRLNFRDEHPIASWVRGEIRRAFPHICCRDTVELERERSGLTKEGTIRNGTRHSKDDRKPLGSRGDYVLGWSPERKIEALQKRLNEDAANRDALF